MQITYLTYTYILSKVFVYFFKACTISAKENCLDLYKKASFDCCFHTQKKIRKYATIYIVLNTLLLYSPYLVFRSFNQSVYDTLRIVTLVTWNVVNPIQYFLDAFKRHFNWCSLPFYRELCTATQQFENSSLKMTKNI